MPRKKQVRETRRQARQPHHPTSQRHRGHKTAIFASEKITSTRIILITWLIAACITFLLTGCGSTAVESSHTPIDQRSPTSESTLSQDPGSANLTDQSPEASQNPENLSNATIPTDHSFWRLVKQGKIDPPAVIASALQAAQDYCDTEYYLLTDVPEIDLRKTPATDPMMIWFTIRRDMAQPGEVISRIYSAKAEYAISVPVLNDELAAYARECGLDYYLIYTTYPDDSRDAELIFYYGSSTITMYAEAEVCSVFPDAAYFGCSILLSSYAAPATIEKSAWETDTVRVSCAGYHCCEDVLLRLLYNEEAYATIIQDSDVAPAPDECMVADKLADFTETSYNATDTQLQILKDLITEFEARPLPEELQKIIAVEPYAVG